MKAAADPLLTVKDVAHLLGLTEHGVRARVARHQLPYRRLGGRILFRQSELLDFLGKQEGGSVGESAREQYEPAMTDTTTPEGMGPRAQCSTPLPCAPTLPQMAREKE